MPHTNVRQQSSGSVFLSSRTIQKDWCSRSYRGAANANQFLSAFIYFDSLITHVHEEDSHFLMQMPLHGLIVCVNSTHLMDDLGNTHHTVSRTEISMVNQCSSSFRGCFCWFYKVGSFYRGSMLILRNNLGIKWNCGEAHVEISSTRKHR